MNQWKNAVESSRNSPEVNKLRSEFNEALEAEKSKKKVSNSEKIRLVRQTLNDLDINIRNSGSDKLRGFAINAERDKKVVEMLSNIINR